MNTTEGDRTFDNLNEGTLKSHYMCLVVQLAKNQVSEEERNAIRRYTKAFGMQSWLHTLIVLSYTKDVKPSLHFATILRDRSNGLRYEIAKYVGWDIASKIHFMASQDLKTIMAKYPAWLAEHHSTIEQATEVSRTSSFFFPLPEDAFLPGILPSPEIIQANKQDRSQFTQDISLTTLPGYLVVLSSLFATSGPLAALGIIMAGPVGCGIALFLNLVVWVVACRFCKDRILRKDMTRRAADNQEEY